MLFDRKPEKKRCFWCGFKYSDMVVVDGKPTCYICLRADDKKRK